MRTTLFAGCHTFLQRLVDHTKLSDDVRGAAYITFNTAVALFLHKNTAKFLNEYMYTALAIYTMIYSYAWMLKIVNRKKGKYFLWFWLSIGWIWEKRCHILHFVWVYVIPSERVDFHLQTKCVCKTQIPLITTNSKEGQCNKYKYLDTSRKILSQEICHTKALIFIIEIHVLWTMPNV